MSKQEDLMMVAVLNVMKPLKTKTSKIRVLEKLGKILRRENSAEIYEAEAKDRLKIHGKRILDVDSNL